MMFNDPRFTEDWPLLRDSMQHLFLGMKSDSSDRPWMVAEGHRRRCGKEGGGRDEKGRVWMPQCSRERANKSPARHWAGASIHGFRAQAPRRETAWRCPGKGFARSHLRCSPGIAIRGRRGWFRGRASRSKGGPVLFLSRAGSTRRDPASGVTRIKERKKHTRREILARRSPSRERWCCSSSFSRRPSRRAMARVRRRVHVKWVFRDSFLFFRMLLPGESWNLCIGNTRIISCAIVEEKNATASTIVPVNFLNCGLPD